MSSLLSSTRVLLKKPLTFQLINSRTFASWRVCQQNVEEKNISNGQNPGVLSTRLLSIGCDGQTNTLNNPWSTKHMRFYGRKKGTIKLPPTKPLRFIDNLRKCDSDISLKALDVSKPRLEFEDVDTLHNADDNIQKIFSLAFGTAADEKQKRLDLVVKAVQEHPADVRSYEVKIAKQTVEIRTQANHVLNYRKDKRAKMNLNDKIGRRARTLRILKNVDKDKFDWLCKELGINFTPPREFGHGKIPNKRAMRKAIARDKFLEIRQNKMRDFQTKLNTAMVEFEKEKAAELAAIQEELREFGITEMNSVDQIIGDLGLGDSYKLKQKQKPPRRQQLLQRKFELYKGGENLYRYNRQKPSQK